MTKNRKAKSAHRRTATERGVKYTTAMRSEQTSILDMVEQSGHALVVGATGTGKTNLLHHLAVSAIERRWTVHMLNFLDGDCIRSFDGWADSVHPIGASVKLPPEVAAVIADVAAEMRAREVLMGENNLAGWSDLRRLTEGQVAPILVAIDELSLFLDACSRAREGEGVLDTLLSIMRTGRRTGIHVVLSSQSLEHTLRNGVGWQLCLESRFRILLSYYAAFRSEAKLVFGGGNLPSLPKRGMAYAGQEADDLTVIHPPLTLDTNFDESLRPPRSVSVADSLKERRRSEDELRRAVLDLLEGLPELIDELSN